MYLLDWPRQRFQMGRWRRSQTKPWLFESWWNWAPVQSRLHSSRIWPRTCLSYWPQYSPHFGSLNLSGSYHWSLRFHLFACSNLAVWVLRCCSNLTARQQILWDIVNDGSKWNEMLKIKTLNKFLKVVWKNYIGNLEFVH